MQTPGSMTSRSLSVALLNPTFWPEVRRGSERLIRDLADGLLAAGHRPRLITGHLGRPSTITDDGLRITRVPRRGGRVTALMGLHEHVAHAPFSYLALRRGSDDLAHAFYAADAWAAARWAERSSRPAVFSVMGIPRPAHISESRLRRRLWDRGLRGSAAVIALSEAAAEPLRDLGISPRVIHPGTDLQIFRPAAERSEVPTILCPSDVTDSRKRVGLLVDAIDAIRRAMPRARLVLSRPRDPSLATASARAPGVELVDLDDQGKLARHYSSAWVTALASRDEAFGLVLVESLACGTPVVASADGGAPEVLGEDGVGVTFDGGSDSLERALGRALEMAREEGVGDRCRARAKCFSIERCVEGHLSLYSELVEAR
jgi:glycosyltransferase involved in cell wall biosynthesis